MSFVGIHAHVVLSSPVPTTTAFEPRAAASSTSLRVAQHSMSSRALIRTQHPSRARASARVTRPRNVSRAAQVMDKTTEEARKCLKFDALIVGDNERAIYVQAVARESSLESVGVVPGMRLRALSDPVEKNSLWTVSNTERLAFVKDAIRSTKQEEITLVFDTREEYAVTASMVQAAMTTEELEEEQRRLERAKTRNETPAGKRVDANGKKIEDRPDLYSDNWQGDEYTGGFWNELTVGLASAVVTPLAIVAIATVTRGVLWDVTRF